MATHLTNHQSGHEGNDTWKSSWACVDSAWETVRFELADKAISTSRAKVAAPASASREAAPPEVEVPPATASTAQFVSSALVVVSHFGHHCASASVAHARSGKLWLDKSARPQLETVWKSVRSDLGNFMGVARKFASVNAQRMLSRRPWLEANGQRPIRIPTPARTPSSLFRKRIRIAHRSRIAEINRDRAREEALRNVQARNGSLNSCLSTLAAQINEPLVTVPAGPFVLQPLPWLAGALAPVMSSRAIQVHHGCHYAACIALSNQLSRNHKELAGQSALDIVCWAHDHARGTELFAAASEAWNHALFWKSLAPSKQRPYGELRQVIDRSFGDFAHFAHEFAAAGAAHTGSGWLWLVANRSKQIKILTTQGTNYPGSREGTCLLAIDLWEHSYYFDHQNRRREYLDALIDRRLNWEFAETRFRLALERGANARRGSQRQLPQNRSRRRKRQCDGAVAKN